MAAPLPRCVGCKRRVLRLVGWRVTDRDQRKYPVTVWSIAAPEAKVRAKVAPVARFAHVCGGCVRGALRAVSRAVAMRDGSRVLASRTRVLIVLGDVAAWVREREERAAARKASTASRPKPRTPTPRKAPR